LGIAFGFGFAKFLMKVLFASLRLTEGKEMESYVGFGAVSEPVLERWRAKRYFPLYVQRGAR